MKEQIDHKKQEKGTVLFYVNSPRQNLPSFSKEIEAERELVEANRKLIEIYERKIQAKLAEIWGETDDAA